MTSEATRIRRKPPRIESGRRWHTWATGKLFLEDIIYIFNVMLDYSDHSPFLLQMKSVEESIRSSREVLEGVAASAGGRPLMTYPYSKGPHTGS